MIWPKCLLKHKSSKRNGCDFSRIYLSGFMDALTLAAAMSIYYIIFLEVSFLALIMNVFTFRSMYFTFDFFFITDICIIYCQLSLFCINNISVSLSYWTFHLNSGGLLYILRQSSRLHYNSAVSFLLLILIIFGRHTLQIICRLLVYNYWN